MHARMLSVVVFLPELSTVARRVLLLELSTHCSRQLYELVVGGLTFIWVHLKDIGKIA